MKKILILTIALIAIAVTVKYLPKLSIKETAEQLYEDGKASVSNIVDEASSVIDSIDEKKDKVEETIEDVQTAAEKLKAAGDAISEITE